jgi:protein SCO1
MISNSRKTGRAGILTRAATVALVVCQGILGIASTPPAAAAGAPGDSAGQRACCRPGAEASTTVAGAEVETVDVPDLELIRADGARVRLRNELGCGKPVVLNFIFTSCTTICPVMTATFARVQEQLGADRDQVRMISVSIDPEYDTPARLEAFAREHAAGPEWHFLTGSQRDIEAVQKAFGAYRGSKFNHSAVTFLRGANEASWRKLTGLRSAGDLEAEVRRVVAECQS